MKRLIIHCLVASCLPLFSLAASAQTLAPVPNSYYSQDEYQLAHSMFDRVRSDLDRAQTSVNHNDVGDTSRFDIASMELGQLEHNWDQARFDSRQLEDTLSAIRMVLNDNRLAPYDQEALSSDLSRLLNFQTDYY